MHETLGIGGTYIVPTTGHYSICYPLKDYAVKNRFLTEGEKVSLEFISRITLIRPFKPKGKEEQWKTQSN